MCDEHPVVLIVDDQPTNLAALANALQADYRIKPVTNGADALVSASQVPVPDVILLDVMMPEMDGYAVCAALKANPATAAIPVIFITAQTDAASETLALKSGAVDFIHKPINPTVVQARVQLHRELAQHRQHLEVLVHARTLELAQARDAAESANRAKTAFLSNASHEMLTPLNHIIGMGHLLAREILPGRAQERLERINEASNHLLGVIRRLLDLAQLEANDLTLACDSFELKSVLEQAIAPYRAQTAAKGLGLDLVIDAGTPARLVGDPERLGQVLTQLLDNAVKFSDAGRISLTARTGEHRGSNIDLRFTVTDQGPGLPPEVTAGELQQFQPGDNSLTRRHRGLGLGLALSQRLVRLMGGELRLSSVHEQGTTASVWVPFGLSDRP